MKFLNRFKKRYILLGVVAFECVGVAIAIPAAAQIIDRVSFSVPQKVASVSIDNAPGKTQLVVTSNAAFTVLAEGAVGEFDVSVHQSGQVGTSRFGDNAQMPGPAFGCAAATHAAPIAIYRAERKTAAGPGDILSQSVIIEINFDPALSPKFSVKTEENSVAVMDGTACERLDRDA